MKPFKKILLAEDDEDDRMIFDDIVEQLKMVNDFTFSAVDNGLKVIQLLAQLETSALPDLIILDQNMPQMNGKEALGLLKEDPRLKHIPVVIYSTFNDARLAAICLEMGADQVITKPDSYEGFNAVISQLVGKYLFEKVQ
ncbi:response regulator [Chitinophaga sp. RAB17]|uniref:response regulator n=1 Tax=Chitinophaga sp. RAB17 TaxID=3233049 RepID=UPI003F8DF71A